MIVNLPPDTVRSRIKANLMARFENAREGVGGRYLTWNTIGSTPITNTQGIAGLAISIIDTRERKVAETGYQRVTLQVNTEFHVKLAKGDEPAVIGQLVLGEVQTIMLADIYCGGLSLHVVEVGNEIDVGGPTITSVSGIVFWEILYRHKAGDPRKLVGE